MDWAWSQQFLGVQKTKRKSMPKEGIHWIRYGGSRREHGGDAYARASNYDLRAESGEGAQ